MGGVVKILIMRPAHFSPGVILAKFHPAATKKAENVALDQIFVEKSWELDIIKCIFNIFHYVFSEYDYL